MIKQIVITGVSTGIGKALADFFLGKNYEVIGIGRRNLIDDGHNYTFIKLDLSSQQAVTDFSFPKLKDEVVLINNAGVLGEVELSWNQSSSNFATVLQVNLLSLATLCQKFTQTVEHGVIFNISSGAAKRPIIGWSAYCTSKAAVDMYSACLQEELNYNKKEICVKSISPGVVDTNMQKDIRQSSEEAFPNKTHFIQLKENNQLADAQIIAEKIYFALSNLDQFPLSIISLSEISLV